MFPKNFISLFILPEASGTSFVISIFLTFVLIHLEYFRQNSGDHLMNVNMNNTKTEGDPFIISPLFEMTTKLSLYSFMR